MNEHDDRLVRRVVEAAGGHDPAAACPDAEVLGLYAERGLDADERALVERHVVDCARCQAALAAFVRSAPEIAASGAGVPGSARSSWWTGWRWLVPVAATAAVAVVAVWVQRPAGSLEAPRAEYAAPEIAGTAPVPPGGSASQAAESAVTQGLSGRAPAGAVTGSRDAAPLAPSALADAEHPSRPAAARRRQAPETEDFAKAAPLARAEANASAAASAPAAAPPAIPPAEERPVEARERQAAAAEPAPPAVGSLQEAITVTGATSAQARAKRPADRVDAARAEAAAPAPAKAAAGSDSARLAGAGALAKQTARLTGRITYRTRAALPEGAVIDVRLLDVSRVDAPATLLGRVEIVTRGEQVPLPFAVAYDPAAIDPRRRYTVQVTIAVEGRVAYRTTTAHAVLTNGAPTAAVEVVVEPMR